MPNYLQLIRKSDLAAGPVILQKVDDELRVHFQQPPDPDNWLAGWYGIIGQSIAFGRTFQELHIRFTQDATEAADRNDEGAFDFYEGLILINQYLAENFTTEAWARIGK